VRRALAALAVAVAAAACSSRPAPRPTAAEAAPARPSLAAAAEADDGGAIPRGESAREDQLIARVLKKVSAARKLPSKTPVAGVVLDRNALLARVKDHVAREVPDEAIAHEGLVLQLLGFIPTQFDYKAETFALLEAQLAGFYEPADRTMYMAADLDDENARATLAHELVHALQDQHFGLADRSKYHPSQGDAASATSALAEGDATSAMLDVLLAKAGRTALDLPEDVFAEQVSQGINTGPGATAPHAMRASLVSPYIDGTLFVHALRRRGGWAAVDAAWREPPTTTEQILHVEKWLSHEPPLTVAAPTANALGAGWTVGDVDTYGELGYRLSLEEWMDAAKARAAAAHWGGDRATLFVNGSEAALAWHVRYDDAVEASPSAHAERAFTAVSAALRARVGPATTSNAKTAAAPFLCIARAATGPIAIVQAKKDIVIVAGPTRTDRGGAWTSAGDCELARRWTNEILAGR